MCENSAFYDDIKHRVGRAGDLTMHVKEVTLLTGSLRLEVRRVPARKFGISEEQLVCCERK